MSEGLAVTDADRERAAQLLYTAALDGGTARAITAIAAALAEERAKARAPFVKLLTLCDAIGVSDHPHAAAYAAVSHDIRRAAEPTP